MKRFMAICAVGILLGCADTRPVAPPVTKAITEKIQATEQRMSVDFMDNQAIRGRATSVYYLVAGDGTMVEVDLKMYARTKVGESIQSAAWK